MNEDAEILSAMQSGIEAAGGPPPSAPPSDDTPATTGSEDAPLDAPTADEGGDSAAGAGSDGKQGAGDDTADAAGEIDPEADRGDGRNARGEFVKKKTGGDSGEDGEGEEPGDGKKTAEGADGKPTGKQKDPVNDPIPEGLKKETHERMLSLVSTAKQLTVERDHYKSRYEEMTGYIAETGATPAQYTQVLDYLRRVNSGDPAQIEQCIQFMQQELVALTKLLGRPVPGTSVSLLDEHPDLKQAVAAGQLTQQLAEELAAARSHQAVRTVHSRQATEEQRAAQALQQQRQKAIQELNELDASLKSDPDYPAKRQAVMATLKAINPQTGKTLIEETHPTQWTALFLKHYALAKPPAPARPPQAKPQNQPLRARNPAGAAVAAPKTALEALEMGLGQLR